MANEVLLKHAKTGLEVGRDVFTKHLSKDATEEMRAEARLNAKQLWVPLLLAEAEIAKLKIEIKRLESRVGI